MSETRSLLERAFDYLWNADPKRGRVSIAHFDEDHEPIGPNLRSQLERKGWVYVAHGYLQAERPPRRFWEPSEAPGEAG